jgi:hypothetical protein
MKNDAESRLLAAMPDRCGDKKTVLADGWLINGFAQALAAFGALVLTFTLAAAVLRLLYARRRFRFSPLLYCLPIRMYLYFDSILRLFNDYDD